MAERGWLRKALREVVGTDQQVSWSLQLSIHEVCVLSVNAPSKLNIALSSGLTHEIKTTQE